MNRQKVTIRERARERLVATRAALVKQLVRAPLNGATVTTLGAVAGALQALDREWLGAEESGGRAIVGDGDNHRIALALLGEDGGAIGAVGLDARAAIALASELINAAMPRLAAVAPQ